MDDVHRDPAASGGDDPHRASQLLPLLYDELRRLAAAKLAQETPGQTLQPTALVHEAYLRLVGQSDGKLWNSRGHFFAAAAEAMRRILVENARRKHRQRHGGERNRVDLDDPPQAACSDAATIIAVDEVLTELAAEDPMAGELVKLHFFAGLTLDETAELLAVSRATVYRQWAYARSWLKVRLATADHSLDSSAEADKL